MAQTLIPGEILALSGQAADRLLRLDNGDAALLYLYLLRRGMGERPRWSAQRLEAAMQLLQEQGLAPRDLPLPDPKPQELPPPEYALEDITAELQQPDSSFPALCDAVERRLGKKLTANDLKALYTLYDHLSLPAEVILMLVGWCAEETERRYGPGRRPSLSYISKEGFGWARRGIDTMERAEEHLRRLTRLRSREGEVLRLLDIPLRPLVEREKAYIEGWDDMGFDDGALRLAYEKTVMKKQSMDWSYMNGILRRWHEKGLHTAAAVQTGDREPRPVRAGGPSSRPFAPQEETRTREDMERMRRLMEQIKQEGGGTGGV
ncbi:MAG: DnaD domain protein [Lawsonibacter sp.]